MTYLNWLAAGPYGYEGATLIFDIAVGLCLFGIGAYLVVNAWKEAQ